MSENEVNRQRESQGAETRDMEGRIERLRDLIEGLDIDALGVGSAPTTAPDGQADVMTWSIRDEAVAELTSVLAALRTLREQVRLLQGKIHILHRDKEGQLHAKEDAIIALREQVERLTEKALLYDLDAAGIERRNDEAVELVELRAEVERLRGERDRLRISSAGKGFLHADLQRAEARVAELQRLREIQFLSTQEAYATTRKHAKRIAELEREWNNALSLIDLSRVERVAELEAALREISKTTKGYPNASREGEIARRALNTKEGK